MFYTRGEKTDKELTTESDEVADLIEKPVTKSGNWRQAGKLVHAWKIRRQIHDNSFDDLAAELDALQTCKHASQSVASRVS